MKEDKKRRKEDDEYTSSKHKKIDCSSVKPNKIGSNYTHYPMSERQQYALLKQMDDDNPNVGIGRETSETSSNISGHSNDSTSFVTADRKIHKRNATGETLLIQMAKKGDLSAIKTLIMEGANVNEQDYAGWSALHECSIRNFPQIAHYLLQHDADVNLYGLNGETALHDAVRSSCIEVVRILLRYGADPRKRNDKGVRPIDLASTEEIRKILSEAISLLKDKKLRNHRDIGGSSNEKYDLTNKIKDPYAFEDEEPSLDKTQSCKATPTKYGKLLKQNNFDNGNTSSKDQKVGQVHSPDVNSESCSSSSNNSPKVPPLRIKIAATTNSSTSQIGSSINSNSHQDDETTITHNNQNIVSTKHLMGVPSSDSDSSVLSIEINVRMPSNSSNKPCLFEQNALDQHQKNKSESANVDILKSENVMKSFKDDPGVSDSSTIMGNNEESTSAEIKDEKLNSSVEKKYVGGRTLRSHTHAVKEKEEASKNVDKAPIKKRKFKRGDGKCDSEKTIKLEETNNRNVRMPTPLNIDINSSNLDCDTSLKNIQEEQCNTNNGGHQMLMSPSANVFWENPYKKAALLLDVQHRLYRQLEVVHPKPPVGYQDFLITNRKYLTTENVSSNDVLIYKKRTVPSDLRRSELINLFNQQEERRYLQALKHQSEREHLRIVAEQEVIRAHSKAARQLAGQEKPYSFCSVMNLQNSSNIISSTSSDFIKSEKNNESQPHLERFSSDEFIKFLKSVKQKYDDEKRHILLRQLHESESLMMVQKMDWELKLKDLLVEDLQGDPSLSKVKSDHVPNVEVPEDFALFNTDPFQIPGFVSL